MHPPPCLKYRLRVPRQDRSGPNAGPLAALLPERCADLHRPAKPDTIRTLPGECNTLNLSAWEAPQTSYPPGEDRGGWGGAMEEVEAGLSESGAEGRAVVPPGKSGEIWGKSGDATPISGYRPSALGNLGTLPRGNLGKSGDATPISGYRPSALFDNCINRINLGTLPLFPGIVHPPFSIIGEASPYSPIFTQASRRVAVATCRRRRRFPEFPRLTDPATENRGSVPIFPYFPEFPRLTDPATENRGSVPIFPKIGVASPYFPNRK